MAAETAVHDIPTDKEVLDTIGSDPEGRVPSEVLAALMESGHSRANSQRAIQRVLDRGKVEYTTSLRLVNLVKQKLAA